jgi:hypothetical protein
MDIALDDIQNESREPVYTEHLYQGNQAPSLFEQRFRAYRADAYRLRGFAAEYFSDPDRVRELPARCATPDAKCFLVLGRGEIIGYGRDLGEASRKAEERGFQASDCLTVFYPEALVF